MVFVEQVSNQKHYPFQENYNAFSENLALKFFRGNFIKSVIKIYLKNYLSFLKQRSKTVKTERFKNKMRFVHQNYRAISLPFENISLTLTFLPPFNCNINLHLNCPSYKENYDQFIKLSLFFKGKILKVEITKNICIFNQT